MEIPLNVFRGLGVFFMEIYIYRNIIIADINKIRYNISVVLPIPGNRGRCSLWKSWFLFLLLSWLVWLATVSTNG